MTLFTDCINCVTIYIYVHDRKEIVKGERYILFSDRIVNFNLNIKLKIRSFDRSVKLIG